MFEDFDEIWCCDFEYSAPDGERPRPVCMVAKELRTGRYLRLWEDDLARARECPFRTDGRALFVAYYASAEFGCFRALGWSTPCRILDLFIEFKALTNGLEGLDRSLIGALSFFGLDAVAAAEKAEMRTLALRGGPWTASERMALLAYCQTDVDALERLLPAMSPFLATGRNLKFALRRGLYMPAAAAIEWLGVPLDVATHRRIVDHWDGLKDGLVRELDADYGVFVDGSFSEARWARWVVDRKIPWPLHEDGRLSLTQEVFREIGQGYPTVARMGELRYALSKLRLKDLSIGRDGRNRCMLSAFRAKTGRNQPKSGKFIFGPSVWIRGLIRPAPGTSLAYIDWTSQEIAIVAALSGDQRLMDAYLSGDIYLAFAKDAGLVPATATKRSHKAVRDRCKSLVLGLGYGMGAWGLACRIGLPLPHAEQLIALHKATYPRFWAWADAAVDCGMLFGRLDSVFGWPLRVTADARPNTLRNYPAQANGSEMLRTACVLAIAAGVKVVAPVHDALLIEAPDGEIDQAIATTRDCMAAAGRDVLGGFAVRTESVKVTYPARYRDERGGEFWTKVLELLPTAA
jgi:hypothetical protein